MAAKTGAIVFSTELDLAPLQRDWAKAEAIGKAGSAKVQASMTNATKAGFTGGGMRKVDWAAIAAERAQVSGFASSHTASGRRIRTARDFAPAPAGKYPSPLEVENLEGTRANRRMIRGIGGGLTAVAGVHQLAEAYKTATRAAGDLEARVNSITKLTGSGTFRGIGEMETNLREASSAIEEIQNRKFSEIKRDERDPMMTLAFLKRKTRQFVTGDSDVKEEERIARLRDQASKDIDGIAQKQESLNEAERQSTMYSERQGLILKAEIAHRERLGQLAEMESAAGVNNPAARNAETGRARNEIQAINKVADAREREVELETQIGLLGQSNLTTDQQRVAAAKLRLAALQAQLNVAGNTEKAARIQAQMGPAQTEVSRGQYAESKKPWQQRTEEMREQQDYQNFVARQMPSNANAYLSHPDATNRRDILGNRLDEAGNVAGTGGGSDKQGVGLLGTPGVLDRIEQKLEGVGANK